MAEKKPGTSVPVAKVNPSSTINLLKLGRRVSSNRPEYDDLDLSDKQQLDLRNMQLKINLSQKRDQIAVKDKEKRLKNIEKKVEDA